jgi:glycine/serine hydroxymethyltransferase
MKEAEMRAIAGLIDRVLRAPDDKNVAAAVRKEVEVLAAKYPLYPAQKI